MIGCIGIHGSTADIFLCVEVVYKYTVKLNAGDIDMKLFKNIYAGTASCGGNGKQHTVLNKIGDYVSGMLREFGIFVE